MGALGVGLGILGAVAVGWVVAPVVSLARHGSIDQRTLASWRAEGTDRGGGASDADRDPGIPHPRSPRRAPPRAEGGSLSPQRTARRAR